MLVKFYLLFNKEKKIFMFKLVISSKYSKMGNCKIIVLRGCKLFKSFRIDSIFFRFTANHAMSNLLESVPVRPFIPI